jgi:hypothetical protein
VLDTPTDVSGELETLEADLKRLEAEHNMFFTGRLPCPPWETRWRVEAALKRLDGHPPSKFGDRFRFQTLQSRHAMFAGLWDCGLRAREEGRPGPFSHMRPPANTPPAPTGDRSVDVTSFCDPMEQMDKLEELYERLVDVRREQGDGAVPFHRFADLVRTQVTALRKDRATEVAFRVAVKDGKIAFTARGLKGVPQ